MQIGFAARQDSASVSLQLRTWNSGSVGWRSGEKMARRKEGVSGGLEDEHGAYFSNLIPL